MRAGLVSGAVPHLVVMAGKRSRVMLVIWGGFCLLTKSAALFETDHWKAIRHY